MCLVWAELLSTCVFGWPRVFTLYMLFLVLSVLIVAVMLKWLFKKKDDDVEKRDSADSTKVPEKNDGSTNSASKRKRDTPESTDNSSIESEPEVKKKRAGKSRRVSNAAMHIMASRI